MSELMADAYCSQITTGGLENFDQDVRVLEA